MLTTRPAGTGHGVSTCTNRTSTPGTWGFERRGPEASLAGRRPSQDWKQSLSELFLRGHR